MPPTETFTPDAATIAARVTACGQTVVSEGTDTDGRPCVVAVSGGCMVTFTLREVLTATLAVSGTVTSADYVAAIVAANNANTNPQGVKVTVDGDRAKLKDALADPDNPLVLLAERHLVPGDGVTAAQLAGFVGDVFTTAGQLVDFAARLACDPDHDDLDNAPEKVFTDRRDNRGENTEPAAAGQWGPASYDRVAAWFSARGIDGLPYDEATGTVCLMMDGTPIDIVVDDACSVTIKIGAQLPATGIQEPGTIVHACNHANLAFRSTVCAARSEGNWWVVSRLVVPQTGGLSDSQLDQLIATGVLEVAAQLKQTLKSIRES